MSDYVSDSIYAPFVAGSAYAKNMGKDKKQLLTAMYMRKLASACVARYSWINLPPEIDRRYLEVTLYFTGLALFTYESEFDKYQLFRAQGSGQLNMYDNPIGYTAYANNLLSRQITADDCVPIWGNNMRVPDHDMTTITASRLTEFDMTIDQLTIGSRHPVLLVSDDQTRQSTVAIWRQLAEGQPFIGVHKGMGQDIDEFVKGFDLGFNPTNIPTLQIAKTRVLNEFMGYMGINNANQDKRERLVSDEVSANNSQIGIFRSDAMDARMYACEQINERYGLNISVEWNEQPVESMESGLTEDSFDDFGGGE